MFTLERSPHKFTSAAEVRSAFPLDRLISVALFYIVIIVRSAKQPQIVFGTSSATSKKHNVNNFQVPGAATQNYFTWALACSSTPYPRPLVRC